LLLKIQNLRFELGVFLKGFAVLATREQEYSAKSNGH